MTHGSLFSGLGGFDLAAEWMQWDNIFHCEKDDFLQKILNYYWPNAKTHKDIKETNFTVYRGRVDILSGGFPCQPYSEAGKRLGTADDRHLWPEMLRAIREIQPRWVVPENVRGLTTWNDGMVFDQIQADMESEGYEVIPFLLPAAGVNAPHRRDRIWIVAHAIGDGHKSRGFGYSGQTKGTGQVIEEKREWFRHDSWRISKPGASSDTAFNPETAQRGNREWPDDVSPKQFQHKPSGLGNQEHASDTQEQRLERSWTPWRRGPGPFHSIERHDSSNTISGFQPFQSHDERMGGGKKSYPKITWDEFPTQPPVCSGNDGLPTGLDGITVSKWRKHSIQGFGNAIVPHVAFQIFQAIQAYEKIIQGL